MKADFSRQLHHASSEAPVDRELLLKAYLDSDAEVGKATMMLEEELDKRKKRKEERARCRHDYGPLVFEVLRLLAQRGALPRLIQRAKKSE